MILNLLNKTSESSGKLSIEAKASMAYTISSVIQKILSFITLPLFTRILTKSQYGQCAVYESWMGILTIIITFNLPYGSFSKAMIKYDKERETYISTVNSIAIINAVIIGIIYFCFNDFLREFMEFPNVFFYVMLVQIISTNAIQCWYGINRFDYKYKKIVSLTIITSIISPVIALGLVFYSFEKGYARIIGYAIVPIIVGCYICLKNYWMTKKCITKEFLKYALTFNVPLLFYYFSQMIFNQSDRIMIDKMCGTDKVALYSIACTISMVLSFVLNSINSSYEPWLYKKINAGAYKENAGVSLGISLIMSILLLGIIWFAPEIIYILAGKEYLNAVWTVVPLTISQLLLFYSQLSINIEFYFEEKKNLILASIGAAVINIALNYLFLPEYGYYVAGYTTLLSYCIFMISNYLVIRKHIGKNRELYGIFNIKGLIMVLFCFIIISLSGMFLYRWIWARMLISVIVLISIFINRRKLISKFRGMYNA